MLHLVTNKALTNAMKDLEMHELVQRIHVSNIMKCPCEWRTPSPRKGRIYYRCFMLFRSGE